MLVGHIKPTTPLMAGVNKLLLMNICFVTLGLDVYAQTQRADDVR